MSQTLVVVPVYSHWDYALKTVESLYRATRSTFFDHQNSVDCVVYDDGSPDYTAERERELLAVDPRVSFYRYANNAGMTRSWNAGLALARYLGREFCCLANSDLLFTPGWDTWLRDACKDHALTGPVSNAAGHTSRFQDVALYAKDYKLSDDWADLCRTADELRVTQLGKVVPARVNGFCMMTRTEVAWRHAFDADNVFDPSCPMAGNEDRLQDRWKKAGLRFAVVPSSYVFHYRSVTRGDRYKKGRWMRMPQTPKRGEL